MGVGTSGDICIGGRSRSGFNAPNTDHIVYTFNVQEDDQIKLCSESRQVSRDGFAMEPPAERSTPKWYTVKEYTGSAAQRRICVSGRCLVRCPEIPTAIISSRGVNACVFSVCTRGRPVYESVRTQSFTHTAHVVTSGVFYTLSLLLAPGGSFYLCPRIVLVLDSGDEVVSVDDKLGPISPPTSFYVDFACVDEGGRNVQMDVIFRAVGDEEEGGVCVDVTAPAKEEKKTKKKSEMRTLRTCLQDYTALNSQVQPASTTLGYSTLATHMSGATAHMQNLVISEECFETPTLAEPQPFDVWKEAAHRPEIEALSKILFEGQDAHVASTAMTVPGPHVKHPQLQPPDTLVLRPGLNGGTGVPETRPLLTEPTTEDFWYHIQYGADGTNGGGDFGEEDYGSMQGEFWLTKQAVDKKGVYFHCSSTLAQALTMCIVFRFSCPLEYLTIIESNGANILRDTHIPTNGLVMGVERDPRHESLVRMFLEHRNEIVDDIVICEAKALDLARCVVYQEVYDSGNAIIYRITLMHADGAADKPAPVWRSGCKADGDAADEHRQFGGSLRPGFEASNASKRVSR
eukprot:TRINITY_DN7655_c0_g1_i1.p1 TRINITY_DN7655_c0_g1~~TRINITY_DN7655_c0_g1_i1.p1  ORF type:complete len:605 (-),score=95.83 TRINITY_DN7655_c0_g1_i1:493-2211(-)